MPRPIQGQQYIVQNGDTLPSIAIRAGLIDNWPLIRDANSFVFKTDNQEQIQTGEVIYIPHDPEIIALKNI